MLTDTSKDQCFGQTHVPGLIVSCRRRSDWLSSASYSLIFLLRHRKALQCVCCRMLHVKEGQECSERPQEHGALGVRYKVCAQVRSDARGFPSARQIQRWNVDTCLVGNAKGMRYLQKLQFLSRAPCKKNMTLPVIKK